MHDLEVTTPGPHRDTRAPSVPLPQNSCDAHVHLFGPHDRFPFAPDRTFTPEDVSLEDLEAMHRTLGFERAVLVQSAAHGSDHSVLLDALERGQGRYRATALLSRTTTEAEVASLDAAGFCGTRIHFAPHLGQGPTEADIERLADLVGPYGWHLEVHAMGDALRGITDLLHRLPIRIVLDHMGRFENTDGVLSPGFQTVAELLAGPDVWVKLSGIDRMSRQLPSMRDGIEIARRLSAAFPERCVWGSDYPHPNTHGFVPRDEALVDALTHIVPDADGLKRLLVDNAEECFGFGTI
ncbi:amidohydrolase family protein [Pseudoclavibacter sp. 8L]|uniref:amidohydrolase family protein n=1 Tax=Pseudoclavibacter sp. 8L TaxID=2653162 RepID=UPI0012F26A45|nr:amidohydrolase family protein [Pseudoclavibacter sp. 8L]VXC06782.1 Predicted metal-dependent hydrolase, TIM-barrel fold [Pseudoclavibacter sp. 8L]